MRAYQITERKSDTQALTFRHLDSPFLKRDWKSFLARLAFCVDGEFEVYPSQRNILVPCIGTKLRYWFNPFDGAIYEWVPRGKATPPNDKCGLALSFHNSLQSIAALHLFSQFQVQAKHLKVEATHVAHSDFDRVHIPAIPWQGYESWDASFGCQPLNSASPLLTPNTTLNTP